MKKWFDDYNNLDLLNGKICFISEDDEDMIEIHYKDGMLIDVGYIERMHSYFITVVSSDTDEGWKNPLEKIKIENKAELFDKIQETICKYRKKNYITFLPLLVIHFAFAHIRTCAKLSFFCIVFSHEKNISIIIPYIK